MKTQVLFLIPLSSWICFTLVWCFLFFFSPDLKLIVRNPLHHPPSCSKALGQLGPACHLLTLMDRATTQLSQNPKQSSGCAPEA